MYVFLAEIRKIMYTPVTTVLLYKNRVYGGQSYLCMFS